MNEEQLAALLAETFLHTVTARRPALEEEWTLLCSQAPCALSRSAQVSAPTPPDAGAPLPESQYRYSLFTGPRLRFQLGDRLEVSDGQQVYRGRASDSFSYPSHTVTVLEVRETVPVQRAEP